MRNMAIRKASKSSWMVRPRSSTACSDSTRKIADGARFGELLNSSKANRFRTSYKLIRPHNEEAPLSRITMIRVFAILEMMREYVDVCLASDQRKPL